MTTETDAKTRDYARDLAQAIATDIVSMKKRWDSDDDAPCAAHGEIDCDNDSCYFDSETVQREVTESAYGVSVRSGWSSPGEKLVAEEFTILMAGGGPACQITGDLWQGSPSGSTSIQYQDWFTPWVDLPLSSEEQEALDWFAGYFFFGE